MHVEDLAQLSARMVNTLESSCRSDIVFVGNIHTGNWVNLDCFDQGLIYKVSFAIATVQLCYAGCQ